MPTSPGTIEQDTKAGRLRIRTRVVVAGDGAPLVVRTVHCPARGRSASLTTCTRCGHAGTIRLDRRPGRSYVACRPPGIDPVTPTPPHTDLLGLDSVPVGEIMRDVVCVTQQVTQDTLLRLLVDCSYGGVPVVDREGYAVGVVSKTDLVRGQALDGRTSEALDVRPTGPLRETGVRVVEDRALAGPTVAEVMTPVAFTVPESATIADAAALMACEGVHRVPIVDEDGKVIGLLSALDLVRWLAERAGYLRVANDLPPSGQAGGG